MSLIGGRQINLKSKSKSKTSVPLFVLGIRCFLVESKFTGVYINLLRSRQLHVIYRDYFITFIERWCTRRFYL